MVIRAFVVGAVLMMASSTAHADAWYFEWHCAGACAPNQLAISGVDGPFGSEGSCDRARSSKLAWALGPGSAGSATSCSEAGATGGVPGSSAPPVTLARFDRMFVGMTTATGFTASYANGSTATGGRQLGGELEIAFGFSRFGLSVLVGVVRDAGTAPDPMTTVEPMWLAELGAGLVSSPFAVIHTGSLELRPDIGVYVVDLERVGCTRCNGDPIAALPGEATGGFGTRLRAGLDVYFGEQHSHGLAIDALFQFAQIGRFGDDTAPTSVELRAPRVMLRLSWIPLRNND
jgi:hypothetical protein